MKSVFISYRRIPSFYLARNIYSQLKSLGHDVFFDIERINNGEFEEIILKQIRARPHFVLILENETLKRTINEYDLLRIEIEEAIKTERNIIPVTTENFNLEANKKYLTGLLAKISDYQFLPLYPIYFDAFISKLIERFEGQELTKIKLEDISPLDKAISNIYINRVELKLETIKKESDTDVIIPIPKRDFRLSDVYKELELRVAFIDISGKLDYLKEESVIGLSNGKNYSLTIPIAEKKLLYDLTYKQFPKRSQKWRNLYVLSYFITEVIKSNKRKIDYFIIDDEYRGNKQEFKNIIMANINKLNLKIISDNIRIQNLGKRNPAHEIAINVKRGKNTSSKIYSH